MPTPSYLVIGGAGFLGWHIVDALVRHGNASVAVYDLNEPLEEDKVPGVLYFRGDIIDEDALVDVLKMRQIDLVFHAASPVHGLKPDIYYRVNQEGTQKVLSACDRAGVKKLVYTSSTGVVWQPVDFNGPNEEQAKIPSQGYDAYHHTKALGEKLVIDANGVGGLNSVALRPCGMTGERDSQMIWRLAKALKDGNQNVQIGDNTNLLDYVYAGNVADAHILAAGLLFSNPERVAGEVFFITNGSPMRAWDFNRLVWKELGDDGSKKIVKLPSSLAMLLASLSEFFAWLTGSPTEFTRYSVQFTTKTQWYNIDKARKVLGYEPKVSLEEGVRRAAKWWKETGEARHAASLKRSR